MNMMTNTETLAVMEAANVSIPNRPLHELVRQTLDHYFSSLDTNVPPSKLYTFVIEQVEHPLLQTVLKYTKNNQFKAAKLLGISRSTLRKKLKIYGLENP